MASNQENLIGTLTPNVYVSRITLENTAKPQANEKRNSIIANHTMARPPGLDLLGSLSLTERDFIATKPITSDSPSKMKIKVDMVIKEQMGGLASFWADKPEYHEYIKIMGYFTRSSLATKILAVGSNGISFCHLLAGGSGQLLENIALSINVLIVNGLLSEKEKKTLEALGVHEASWGSAHQSWKGGFKPAAATSTSDATGEGALTPMKPQLRLKDMYKQPAAAAELISIGDPATTLNAFKEKINKYLTDNVLIPAYPLTLSDVMGGDKTQASNATVPYTEKGPDGQLLKNYQFSIEHVHYKSNPKHLSFSVLSYLDLEKMSNDFGLDFQKLDVPHGKLVFEQIIDDHNVDTKSFVYTNPSNGNIWSGPVHKSMNLGQNVNTPNWRTGFTESKDSFTVVKTEIPDSTIQDFRVVDKLERTNFDLSFLETHVYNSGKTAKHITNDKMDVLRQPSYFTPLYLARDYAGNARFMFGIDYNTLLIENTLYGRVGATTTDYSFNNYNSFLLKNTKIINFKIKRRRVKNIMGQTRLGGAEVKQQPFKTGFLGESHIDDEEIIETIAATKDIGNMFGSIPALNEQLLYLPKVKNDNVASYGTRFFQGIDTSMSTKGEVSAGVTDGTYQYGVELEILDNTVQYVLDEIKKLYKIYQMVDDYYQASILPLHYNPQTNKFKSIFSKKWKAVYYGKIVKGIAQLTKVIDHFSPPTGKTVFASISQQVWHSDAFDPQQVTYALAMISNPKTGTPRGVHTLKKIAIDICSKLAKIAGTSLKHFDDNPHTNPENSKLGVASKVDPVSGPQPDRRRIKIDYWFSETFNSDIAKGVGYDFLSSTGEVKTGPLKGLHSIGGTEFKDRMKQEMVKFFKGSPEEPLGGNFKIQMHSWQDNITENDTPATTGYTFFSPSSVNLGTNGKSVHSVWTSSVKDPQKVSELETLKSNWSLLNNGVSLKDRTALSYIASKIMNYNYTGMLPFLGYDTTKQGQGLPWMNLSPVAKAYEKITFALNNILEQKSCRAIVINKDINIMHDEPAEAKLQEYFDQLGNGQNVDSIEEQLTPMDVPISLGALPDEWAKEYLGGGQNHLFLALAYHFGNDCWQRGWLEANTSGGTGAQLTPGYEPAPQFNLKFFKLDWEDPNTILSFLKVQLGIPPQEVSGLEKVGSENTDPQIRKIFSELPNAIKTLFIGQNNYAAKVRYDWSTSDDLMANAYNKAAYALNYQNIKRIEVFSGFIKTWKYGAANSAKTTPAITAPEWTDLTKEIFDEAAGKNLLCRLTTYQNNAFGIRMSKCLDLPVFHEYFLLNPSNFLDAIPGPRGALTDKPPTWLEYFYAPHVPDPPEPDYANKEVGWAAELVHERKNTKDNLITADIVSKVVKTPSAAGLGARAQFSRGEEKP